MQISLHEIPPAGKPLPSFPISTSRESCELRDMWKSFGSFIKYRRQRLGLTQRQLADQLGLKSAAFLSDIESGNRHPSASLFPALARVLETDIRDLQNYDTRHALGEVRTLLDERPEIALHLGRIVSALRFLGPEEVLRRLDTHTPPPAAPIDDPVRKPRKPAILKKPVHPALAPSTETLGL